MRTLAISMLIPYSNSDVTSSIERSDCLRLVGNAIQEQSKVLDRRVLQYTLTKRVLEDG